MAPKQEGPAATPRGGASDLSQPGGREDQDDPARSSSQAVVGAHRLPVLAAEIKRAVTVFPSTGLIVRFPNGETSGADPRTIPLEELRNAGHERRPRSAIIRAKCIDCSGGSRFEADHCTAVKCALWPYRRGTNPFSGRRCNSRSFKSTASRPVLSNPATVPSAETAFLAVSGERHGASGTDPLGAPERHSLNEDLTTGGSS
jgi:hypothetical protein